MHSKPSEVKPHLRDKIVPFVIPLSIIGLVVAGMHLSDLLTSVKHHRRLANFERDLRTGTFVPIDEQSRVRDAFSTELDAALRNFSEPISATARQALVEKCLEALAAYHAGEFARFSSFRYPRAIRQNEGMNANFRRDMPVYVADFRNREETRDLLDQPSSLPSPSGYERFLETDYRSYIALNQKNNDVRLCTNCWDQVDLDSIQFQLNRFDKAVSSVHSILNDENSLGAIGHPSHPYITPSPEELIQRKKPAITAYVQWTVMTSTPVEALPVFTHFYWVPEYGEWIPYELVVASEKGTKFFFHF